MQETVFHVAKMDCSAEEQLIRMKLSDLPAVKGLGFDLPARRLKVLHEGDSQSVLSALNGLNMDAVILESPGAGISLTAEKTDARLLWTVLLVNLFFFITEVLTGIWSGSMGLIADSLDMLADAAVYGLSLYAVGKAIGMKKRVARLSGYMQMLLAIVGLAETLRRFAGFEEMPDPLVMILISMLALAGNAFSYYLLQRSGSGEVHIKASLIFTANDVLANIGVIAAGVLVYFTGSRYPDLIIGSVLFVLVARGAIRILRL